MRQGIAEYQKRLGAYCRFEIIELEEYRLPDNPSEAEIARGNAEAALSAAGMQPDRDYRLWIAPRDCPGQMIRF